jgi:hypothetical protein
MAGMALTRQIDQFQRELSEDAEIIEQLRSVSKPEAITVIRRLRSTSKVLPSLRSSAHTATWVSELKALRGTIPPTDFETETELGVLHHSVYPTSIPFNLDTIDIDSLFQLSSSPSPALPPLGMTEQTEKHRLSLLTLPIHHRCHYVELAFDRCLQLLGQLQIISIAINDLAIWKLITGHAYQSTTSLRLAFHLTISIPSLLVLMQTFFFLAWWIKLLNIVRRSLSAF